MFEPRFSPIDTIPWLSRDPNAACCMCPDRFRKKQRAVDYCPQHGKKPDFLLCHDADAGRRWRAEQDMTATGSSSFEGGGR